MRESGGRSPQGVADRSGGPKGGQASPALPTTSLRAAWVVGALALAGWSLVAIGGGGIDPGDGLGGDGPRAAFLALAIGAPLACAALVIAGNRSALRAGPSRLVLGGAAATVAWSGLSILWAAAPDLAWIEANRQAIGLCALVIGLSTAALIPAAPRLLGLGLSVAAMPALALALASKVFPSALGADSDLARLASPVGYWNGLALVGVMAVPGLLWMAGGTRRIRGGPAIAAVGLTVVLITILLTYSRGGILSLAMAVAVTAAFLPRRAPALGALIAATLAAILPTAYALTEPLLSTDQVPTGLREGAGQSLGWRIAMSLAIAGLVAPTIASVAARLAIDRRRARTIAVACALIGVLVVGLGAATSSSARGWADDRLSEFRGEGGDAVANDPSRLVNAAGNQRKGWWGESWRAFVAAPVLGQGAGGFALVHLQERRSGDDALNTREAHGVVPSILSGTGLVGMGLLTMLVGGGIWAVLRAAVRYPSPDIGVPLAIVAAFALQAAVDWSWSIPALTVPAFASAGVVLAAASPGAGARPSRLPARCVGTLTGLGLVAIVSAALPWWSGHLTAQGEDALADGRPAAARDRADSARAANPLATTPLLLLARAYNDLKEPARALGAYREATRLQPDNPSTWRALALFLDQDSRATGAWRQVRRLDPQDPDAALRGG